MDYYDEEGAQVVDEFGEEIDGGGALFESNKKLSFYIIDGGREMLEAGGGGGGEDGDDEPPFKRAAKAIFEQILKVGCASSGGLHHMLSVIVANTASSHPESGLVQHFHEVLPLDFVSGEAAVTLRELASADDVAGAFAEQFGGHAQADLAQIIYYVRRQAKRKARSSRQLAVYYITANAEPFGVGGGGAAGRAMMHAALKNIADLRECDGGEFTCLYIGPAAATPDGYECLRKLDPNFAADSFEELETIVYQKAFAPRAASILPFELAPGLQLDVGLFTLAAQTKRPTPKLVDAETERAVQARTIYKPKPAPVAAPSQQVPPTDDDDEFTEKEEKPSVDGTRPFVFGDTDRARSELKQAIELGGEKIVFSQEELAKLKRFRKGLMLLGFKPIARLRVDRHVAKPSFIYPNEKTTEGSRKLFRALLERCSERQQMMLCYMNVAAHTRPRLVTLVPSRNSDASCDGFHVVQLPLADDCVDGSEIDKAAKVENEETTEQREATRALLRKLTAPFEPFENPNLQKFYSMLIEYATGEAPRRVEDTIRPYFVSEKALARVQPLLNAVQAEFGDLSGKIGKAGAKRGAAAGSSSGAAPEKRGKQEDNADIESAARAGKLSSWTIAQLKEGAKAAGIALGGATKKADIVAVVEGHYGV